MLAHHNLLSTHGLTYGSSAGSSSSVTPAAGLLLFREDALPISDLKSQISDFKSLSDATIRLQFRRPASASAGVVAHYRSPRDFLTARLHANALEILRWEDTTITLLARTRLPANLPPSVPLTLTFDLQGPRLTARLLGPADHPLATASCTTADSLSAAPTPGTVGIRLHGADHVEVLRFDLLSTGGQPLFSTTFPSPIPLSEAPFPPERVAQLRQHLAGTGAGALLETAPPPTLAQWARTFADYLRSHPDDAAKLAERRTGW